MVYREAVPGLHHLSFLSFEVFASRLEKRMAATDKVKSQVRRIISKLQLHVQCSRGVNYDTLYGGPVALAMLYVVQRIMSQFDGSRRYSAYWLPYSRVLTA